MDRTPPRVHGSATEPDSRLTPRPAILLVAALALVATSYSAVGRGDFVWDDRPLIVENPAIERVDLVQHLAHPFWTVSAFKQAHDAYYRPLTTLSYAVDWKLSGGTPGWFHVTNLALHLIACTLVFALARSTGVGPVAAALAAALCGLFPRSTESVAWISGRTDVLASVMGLGALLVHLSRPERTFNRVVAGSLVFVGLLAKEVALAAAVGIVAAELVRERGRGRWRAALVAAAPVALAVLSYVALRIWALRDVKSRNLSPTMEVVTRVLTPFEALGRYVSMIVDALRPQLQIGVLGQVGAGAVAVGIAASIAMALGLRHVWRRGSPEIAALAATAAAALGLVLHLVPIRVSVVAADRFLYLPVAAVSLLLARTSAGWSRRTQRVVATMAVALVPAFAFTVHARTAEWTDEVSLWRRAVEEAPREDAVPIHEYANALFRAGQMQDALAQYQRAADMSTGRRRADALVDVATTLSDLGRLDDAVGIMRTVMTGGSPTPSQHFNLGVLEARRLNFDAAEAEFERAASLLPSYAAARANIAWIREMRVRWAALPGMSRASPPALKARHAAFFEALGVPSRAATLWQDVIRDDSSSVDELLDAAAFATRHDRADEAATALERARARGADASRIGAIEAMLVTRQRRARRE